MITLILPWPPSLNSLYPSSKQGRRFLSKKGKAYHHAVAIAVRQQLGPSRMNGNQLAYKLILYPPDLRMRDISNHLKAIEDCMTQCKVWGDDSYVRSLTAIKGEPVSGGKAILAIWDMNGEYGP